MVFWSIRLHPSHHDDVTRTHVIATTTVTVPILCQRTQASNSIFDFGGFLNRQNQLTALGERSLPEWARQIFCPDRVHYKSCVSTRRTITTTSIHAVVVSIRGMLSLGQHH